MSGTIGGQSIMAQAQSSLTRISRFGTLTTISALGQIVGPVLGGVIIGHTEEPSLASTSSALQVAAWVFVGGLPAAAIAMRTTMQKSTVRTGKPERVWGLLRTAGYACGVDDEFLGEGRQRPSPRLCAVARRVRRPDVVASGHPAGHQLQRRAAGAGGDTVVRPPDPDV